MFYLRQLAFPNSSKKHEVKIVYVNCISTNHTNTFKQHLYNPEFKFPQAFFFLFIFLTLAHKSSISKSITATHDIYTEQ